MELDLGTLALFVGFSLSDEVQQELLAKGFRGLRFAHGFLIPHLVESERNIGELAERMKVSQQAASKSVAELVRLGYLEQTPDPVDRRIRRVRLSPRGRAAIEVARAARAAQQKKLAKRLGKKALGRAKTVLVQVLDELGGAEAVRHRRVPAPR